MISSQQNGASGGERNTAKELNRSKARAPSGRKLVTEPILGGSIHKTKQKFTKSPANYFLKQTQIHGLAQVYQKLPTNELTNFSVHHAKAG